MKIENENLNEPQNPPLNIDDAMCCGCWEKFIGQPLETTDLVWFKDSGLAFVNSTLTTLEPDGFTSIPESWSFGGGCCVNQRSFGVHGVSHVRSNGWVYRDKNGGGDKWDKILYVCKVRKPFKNTDKKLIISDVRDMFCFNCMKWIGDKDKCPECGSTKLGWDNTY